MYAEDPLKDFLPSIGGLEKYTEPLEGDAGVRVDTGIREGSEISIYYDPLISKLVTHAPTRAEAIEKMKEALDGYVIRGVTSNINFLRSLMEHERFLSGDIDTGFIEAEYPDGFKGHINTAEDVQALLVATTAVHAAARVTQLSISGQRSDFSREQCLRKELQGMTLSMADGTSKVVNATCDGNALTLDIEGAAVQATTSYKRGDVVFDVVVDGKRSVFQLVESNDRSRAYTLQYKGTRYTIDLATPVEARLGIHMPIPEVVDMSHTVISPMPGMVFSVNVKVGDEVVGGQEVCVIEAMKMQNAITVPHETATATVKSVNVVVGQTVQGSEVLVELE